MRGKLKIALLLNDFFLPDWQYNIADKIRKSEFAEIVLVIRNNSFPPHAALNHASIARVLVRLIEKADRLVFKTSVDYNLKKNISDIIPDIPCLNSDADRTSSGTDLNIHETGELKKHSLDIILSFGCNNIGGDILKIPRYGIWTYSFDNCRYKNLPEAGFLEVIRKLPVTNSTLGILKPDNKGIDVIFNSRESTCKYSININRDSISWRSALFAPRIMNGLSEYGENYLTALKIRFAHINPENEQNSSPLSLSEAAGSLFRYCGVVAGSIIKKIFFTDAFKWELLFDINDGSDLFSSGYGSFKKISSPRGVFWADPFVIAEEESYYIFVEEFIYRKDRAHISVLKMDKNGNLLSTDKIIERHYHMSYPFVFKIDSTWYMIPETSKNKTIELYRCIEFPDKWEFDRNIMENISAVDTTLFQFNNKWWLFTAVDQTANIAGCSTELFLFFTDDIFSGKWESHPLNPVISDIQRARPAGKLFIRDEKIFRPSQDCAGRYGVGFNINHVTKLTEYEYEETPVTEVKPDWNKKLRGTHTFNFDKDFTIIDVYSFRKRFSF